MDLVWAHLYQCPYWPSPVCCVVLVCLGHVYSRRAHWQNRCQHSLTRGDSPLESFCHLMYIQTLGEEVISVGTGNPYLAPAFPVACCKANSPCFLFSVPASLKHSRFLLLLLCMSVKKGLDICCGYKFCFKYTIVSPSNV